MVGWGIRDLFIMVFDNLVQRNPEAIDFRGANFNGPDSEGDLALLQIFLIHFC